MNDQTQQTREDNKNLLRNLRNFFLDTPIFKEAG
jgi:hypothetical protein